jgi:hypothetical protein
MVEDTLGRAFDMVRQATRDLTPEEMLRPPKPHVAWLTWHMARVQDTNFSGLLGTEQLWIRDGWHARFAMPADPRDYGSGHRQSPTQVDAFKVSDKQLLYAYMDVVFDQTRAYLATVADEELSRVLNEPQYQPLPTLSIRFASVITCNTRHAGQIEYLRGLIKQGGWFPAFEK